jgi:hypothetical protein
MGTGKSSWVVLLLLSLVRFAPGAEPLVGEGAAVLRLQRGGPTAEVTSLAFASPALHKFHSRQVILGLVEKGKPRPLPLACDFHLALPERKPGGTETIHVRGDTDVRLAFDQVVDERKPLPSMSVKRDREWIDWRAKGTYAASGLKAECVHANQYIKEYRAAGALHEVFSSGKAIPAPLKPRMTLWIEGCDKGLLDNDAQVRFDPHRRKPPLRWEVRDHRREFVAPVRLEVESLAPRNGKPIELVRRAKGHILAAKAPEARLDLRGKVVWDDPTEPMLWSPDQTIRIYVNGFQQRPAELQLPAGSPERAFETMILLNRKTDNRIELELAGSRGIQAQVLVAQCEKVKPNQWLHLLVIGAGEEDGKTLLQSVLKAMNANQEKGIWRTDVFSRVEPYGPLTVADDILTPEALQMHFIRIRETMRGRGADSANDIVMIYYKGRELIDDSGHYLVCHNEWPNTSKRMGLLAIGDLARFFARNLGVQLFFLDVMREENSAGSKDKLIEWQQDPRLSRIGVFRYSWKTSDQKSLAEADMRLDSAWQSAMPRPIRLSEVQASLRKKCGEIADRFPQFGLSSYLYVHPSIEHVIVNRRPSE